MLIYIENYFYINKEYVYNIGIIDYLNGNDIVIIEWPEYISDILPGDIIKVYIEHLSEFERKINILS